MWGSLEWTSGGEESRECYCNPGLHITCSGRLRYHQACASVLLTPRLNYLEHTSHLNHAVPSTTLLSSAALPHFALSNFSEANAIQVSEHWSDLEATVKYLRAHPDVAKGIAQRQRRLMVEEGYLSPAAETCYWRALIRGWSKVAMANESDGDTGWGGVEGVGWRTFSLKANVEYNGCLYFF
jgi:hypothetical protein